MPPPFSRNRLRLGWWLILAALFLVFRVVQHNWQSEVVPVISEGTHEVERVVDGDTLVLKSGARVRLQGIDTPETVRPDHPVEPWGAEAAAFTEQFVRRADRRVKLTFADERLDQYQRFLAFVWHDGKMLNEELVRAGLAEARLGYRYSGTMKRRLAAAQDEARANARGIWSEPDTSQ